jgi:hypothetical protein
MLNQTLDGLEELQKETCQKPLLTPKLRRCSNAEQNKEASRRKLAFKARARSSETRSTKSSERGI